MSDTKHLVQKPSRTIVGLDRERVRLYNIKRKGAAGKTVSPLLSYKK